MDAVKRIDYSDYQDHINPAAEEAMERLNYEG